MKLYIHIFTFLLAVFQARSQVSFCAVGDVLLARSMSARIADSGVNYPFEKVRSIVSAADVAFANLECPLCPDGERPPIRKKFMFRGEPEYASGLRSAGFGVVSVANNHALDYGSGGRTATIRALDSAGIAHCGDSAEQGRYRPAIIEKNGVKLAFLAYSDFETVGGAQNFDALLSSIREARGGFDCVVVSMHWGRELDSLPSARQIRMGHQLIDAGAALVIGHHPHVLQGVESYRGKMILYSLGNFVFDNSQTEQSRSAIFRCTIGQSGIDSAELIPISINSWRPEPATGAAKDAIEDKLIRLSAALGTALVKSGSDLIIK